MAILRIKKVEAGYIPSLHVLFICNYSIDVVKTGYPSKLGNLTNNKVLAKLGYNVSTAPRKLYLLYPLWETIGLSEKFSFELVYHTESASKITFLPSSVSWGLVI